MSNETKNILNQEHTAPVEHVRNDWKALLGKLSYSAIVDNVPFLAFVAILCVVYISNNKQVVETQRALNSMNDTLKELRWEYMNTKSQMMSTQMEIEVIKKASDIGLKPMLVPAFSLSQNTPNSKPSAD